MARRRKLHKRRQAPIRQREGEAIAAISPDGKAVQLFVPVRINGHLHVRGLNGTVIKRVRPGEKISK